MLAFDGRGNGRSDRPLTAEAYDDAEFAADALAVLEATGTDRTVLVGCRGVRWAVELATDRRTGPPGGADRPGHRLVAPPHPRRVFLRRGARHRRGLGQVQPPLLARDYRGFLEFFAAQAFSEPHSTKQIEDMVGWGLGTTPRR